MPPKRAGSKSASSSASSSSSSSSSSNSSSSSSSSGSDDSSSDSDSSNSQDSKKSSTNSSHSSSSADEKSKKKTKKAPSRRPSTNALPTTRTTRSSASSASESESPKKAKKSGASAPKTEVKPTKVAPKKSAAAKVKGDFILQLEIFFTTYSVMQIVNIWWIPIAKCQYNSFMSLKVETKRPNEMFRKRIQTLIHLVTTLWETWLLKYNKQKRLPWQPHPLQDLKLLPQLNHHLHQRPRLWRKVQVQQLVQLPKHQVSWKIQCEKQEFYCHWEKLSVKTNCSVI